MGRSYGLGISALLSAGLLLSPRRDLKASPWPYLTGPWSYLKARPILIKACGGKRGGQWRAIWVVKPASGVRNRDRSRVQLEGRRSARESHYRAGRQERGTHQRDAKCKTLHVVIPFV